MGLDYAKTIEKWDKYSMFELPMKKSPTISITVSRLFFSFNFFFRNLWKQKWLI